MLAESAIGPGIGCVVFREQCSVPLSARYRLSGTISLISCCRWLMQHAGLVIEHAHEIGHPLSAVVAVWVLLDVLLLFPQSNSATTVHFGFVCT